MFLEYWTLLAILQLDCCPSCWKQWTEWCSEWHQTFTFEYGAACLTSVYISAVPCCSASRSCTATSGTWFIVMLGSCLSSCGLSATPPGSSLLWDVRWSCGKSSTYIPISSNRAISPARSGSAWGVTRSGALHLHSPVPGGHFAMRDVVLPAILLKFIRYELWTVIRLHMYRKTMST